MLKKILIGVGVVVASIFFSNHRLSMPFSRVIFSGTIECESKSVSFAKGPLKGQSFPNAESAIAALKRQGYSQEGLDQLRLLLQKVCMGQLSETTRASGESSSDSAIVGRFLPAAVGTGKHSTLLKLEQAGSGFKFTAIDKDLRGDSAKLRAYVEGQRNGKTCKQTSHDPPADCYKCEPPLFLWCNIKKLDK
jgi:hypothetical protein